jgi:CelD/BcsL family acetyltransferase involved in cellulose biosynthesis
MNIEEVHGRNGFCNLEGLWNQVCREQQQTSFFLSHRWFRACLVGTAMDVEPIVLIVRDGNTPIGLVPLFRHRTPWRGLPTRVFSLATNQDAPFGDFILPAARAQQAVAAVVEHLDKRRGWHLFVGGKIRRASATHTHLSQLLAGQRQLRQLAARVPVLDLMSDWDTYWTERSQRFKKTVRNVANRMQRLGSISVTDAGAQDLTACMNILHTLAGRSWKNSLDVSVTQSQPIAAFFEDLTAALLERGLLHLWVLNLDGVPVAAEYHVRDGDTVYALRGDFDERYRDASPGAYLNAHIVRTYFERGVRHYDMGPGESEYKQRWATRIDDLDTFIVFHRTPYARALFTLEQHAIPHLRRAREWFRGAPASEMKHETSVC